MNGSFELPDLGYQSVAAGQTLGGWTSSGPSDFEYVKAETVSNLPGLEASGYDGSYWIDLCGTGTPSGLYQMVSTNAGTQYDVSFALAANVWGPAFVFEMEVVWNGSVVGSFSHDTTGRSGFDMGWTLRSVTVTGTGNDRLEFRATNGLEARGAAIDAVTMNVIPAPGAIALLAAGSIGARRRRRRA